MTITAVQVGGTATDSATSASRTTASNVTAGNLVVIPVCTYKPGDDPFVVGDITESGTATFTGGFSLDIQRNQDNGGSDFSNVVVFSAICTGTGTGIFTVGGAPAGSYWNVSVGEFSSDVGWGADRLEDTASSEGTTGAPSSTDGTSADKALFIGILGTETTGATTHTHDAAFTIIDEEEDGSNHMTGSAIYQIAAGGTTDSASWTAPTTVAWAAALAVYKETAPVGGDEIRIFWPSNLDGIGTGGPFPGHRVS